MNGIGDILSRDVHYCHVTRSGRQSTIPFSKWIHYNYGFNIMT